MNFDFWDAVERNLEAIKEDIRCVDARDKSEGKFDLNV